MAVEKELVLSVSLFIHLLHCCWGQPTLIVPSQPVIVPVGSDVTLPCQLDPAKDMKDMVLEWARPDLTPRYVHIRRDGLDLLIDQNSQFQGRTRLLERGLQVGDMSLQLRRVRLSDSGTYRCYIPQMDTGAEVTLHVVSVSPVSVALTKDRSGSPVLRCESRGWYPKPELDWLDSEGTILTAEKTEVESGKSEETFSVSSRLSVEQSHGNTLTCRVRQQETMQSTEAQFTLSGEFLEACPSCSAAWTLFVLLLCLVAAAAAFVVWKYKIKGKIQKSEVTEVKVEDTKVKEEDREASVPLLKPHSDEQKLNEYQEACSRITEELEFVQESDKLLVSKDFLLKLKDELLKCIHDLDTDTEEKLKKIDAFKVGHEKDKKREKQIRKNKEKVAVFKNIMDQTGKEIEKTEEIIRKTTERKGKLKEELKQMKILLENERKRLEANVQLQQEQREDEVKVEVEDETDIDGLCNAFGKTSLGPQSPVKGEELKVTEEQSETANPKEQRSTADGAEDLTVKTEDQTEAEKVREEQTETTKAEEQGSKAEGADGSNVKTEDQTETEKVTQKKSKKTKGEKQGSTAEGEHDSTVKTGKMSLFKFGKK